MQTVTTLGELKDVVGLALTNMEYRAVRSSVDFGTFECSVENFGDFCIATRNFENTGKGFDIPFTCQSSGIHMAFSLNGQSVFNNRVKPFILPASTHALNFFREFQCSNVVDEDSRQYDITFRLSAPFYSELVTSHLGASDDPLPRMIHDQQEFNTINDHVRTDAGMQGILSNIISCPHKGAMKTLFIREHLRALLILQTFHFQKVVTGKQISLDNRITNRDREILIAIKEFIDQHFLEPSSLEGLSRRFGINEFKIKVGFKSLFNASPIRYLQQKRLMFSLALLRDTSKSIKEIADELGYTHAANFTAAFTKSFHKSPLAYRSGKRHLSYFEEVS